MSIIKITDEIHWKLERHPRYKFVWRNAAGGWHDFKETELAEQKIFASSKDQDMTRYLDARRALEGILYRTLDSGLISPKGEYYGCHDHKHIPLLEYVITDEEKKPGGWWMTIRGDGWAKLMGEIPSDPQKETLKKIGRSLDDPKYRNYRLDYMDVFPNGNPVMDVHFAQFEAIAREEEAKLQPAKIKPEEIGLFI